MSVVLPEEAENCIEAIKQKYPEKRSAIMPALYIAQEHFGYINEDAIQWVAEKIDIAPVKVMEVATFYTMYYKKPVGKYHVQVCRTLPCALRGARHLTEYLKERLQVEPGEVTADGVWSYEEVECLGSCGTAPMCEINDRFFEDLSVEQLAALLDSLQEEGGDIRFSPVRDSLGKGLGQYQPSMITGKKSS